MTKKSKFILIVAIIVVVFVTTIAILYSTGNFFQGYFQFYSTTSVQPSTQSVSPPSNVLLGAASYAGTGCPSGTVKSYLSTDKMSVKLTYSAFNVTAPANNTVKGGCNVDILVDMPAGYAVTPKKLVSTGNVTLGASAKADYGTEYYFAGLPGTKSFKSFAGPLTQTVTISTVLNATRSQCGQDFHFRTTADLLVNGGSGGSTAKLSEQVFELTWSKC